jgi:hypothetical protein
VTPQRLRLTPDEAHFADADEQHNYAAFFYDHGVGVFPVNRKKTPVCPSWDDYTCTRAQAWQLKNYGVRLGPLAVVDTDNHDDEGWAAAHVPATPFIVSTGRGKHRYYLSNGHSEKFIYRDGHIIEFRHHGQYVVGPGSRHPDGPIYTPSFWSWRWEDIPFFPAGFLFDDRAPDGRGSDDGPLILPDVIVTNTRHLTLHALMRSLAARGVPEEAAVKVCKLENVAKCRPQLADDEDLRRFLTRAYRQRDTADFECEEQDAWELFGNLFDIGVSMEAVLVACRAVDADFDPEQVW